MGGLGCQKVDNDEIPCDHCWVTAKALIATFLLNNDPFTLNKAIDWENKIFEDTIERYNAGTLNFSEYLRDEVILDMDVKS